MTTPDLVASPTTSTRAFDGTAVIGPADHALAAVTRGDWLEAGIDLGYSGLTALDFVTNPFGTLLSSAFGWAIEHVDPLPDMLNSLAGNPDVIQANAATWANAAGYLRTSALDLRRVVDVDTEPWSGPAVAAYQAVTWGESKLIEAAAVASDAVAAAVSGAGIAVAAVRGTVRDLIAEGMAEIVTRLAEAIVVTVITVGLATAGMIAEVIRIVAKWASRIAGWLNKIVRTLRNLANLIENVPPVMETVRNAMKPIHLGVKGAMKRNAAMAGGTYDDQPFASDHGPRS